MTEGRVHCMAVVYVPCSRTLMSILGEADSGYQRAEVPAGEATTSQESNPQTEERLSGFSADVVGSTPDNGRPVSQTFKPQLSDLD